MSELNSAVRHPASLWQHNPVAVYLLGLSPMLALSTKTSVALALLLLFGLLLTLAVASDAVLTRYLSNYRSATWRLPGLIVLLSVIGTLLDFLLVRYSSALHAELGFYPLLLVCNFAIVVTLESQRALATARARIHNAATLLLAYALLLLPLALLREYLIYGTVLQDMGLLLPSSAPVTSADSSLNQSVNPVFAATPGAAFLLLGLLIALGNLLRTRVDVAVVLKPEVVEPAPRARVTEKLQ